ncbi:ferric reductase-like transmembrane domain-containing protein [uncultured Roseibium sp.]|uniref:ferredoxin reductase family protein n=1 Tax=uncultured Roseibium sp. TaxID=1936171 RepID=UPI002635C3D1|nr:ferric reductase-like transmembrane domain-containing protein [uncultured Roseibium sp.]
MSFKPGILAIGAIIAVFIVSHIVFAPEDHDMRTTITTMLGGIAFLLMTSSVVLSTRLSVLEDMFGGLDRMYQVHRVAGVSTAVFALGHFFGVPKDLPTGVDPSLHPLVPSAPLGMFALIVLVLGLFIALNRKIRYSLWRPTHRSMVLVYLLVVGHFMTAPTIFFQKFSASGTVLMIAGAMGVISAFYSVFGMNRRTAQNFTIESVNALERATEVVLKPVDKVFDFKPGQFAFVEIEGKDWNEPHPFTISSSPGEDRLRFTMKVLGDWTRKVREKLKPGGKVQVRGPYGRFDYTKAGDKQIWLAGGIGITPFLSKLRAMKEDDQRHIHLVYAVREENEALFLGELIRICAKLQGVTIHPLYSDRGEFARVKIMKEKLPDALGTYDYFMCGPKPMIDALRRDLKKEGVALNRIHTEAFEFR